jgi:serine protease AprX
VATKRVIAYGMNEAELGAAAGRLAGTVVTDSYVIGDIDESAIPDLEATGVVVDYYASDAGNDAPGSTRRWLGTEPGADGVDLPDLAPGDTTQWHVTLADGPLLEERRVAIEDTGARLEERVSGASYLVTATQEQADSIIGLDFVEAVTRFGPEVTGPQVLTTPPVGSRGGPFGAAEEEAQTRDWDLWLTDASAREGVLEWLRESAVEVVGSGGRKVRVRVPGDARAHAVATHPDVLNMVEHVPPKLFNDVACGLLGVASVAGDTVPLTGAGQIVAVADTGLDADHPDFAGRVVKAVPLGRPGDSSDPHGHGTHVSGSVLGDGTASGGTYHGVAPQATLYFQSLLDKRGGLGGLPVSLTDLFEPAYEAGARVHNNSWGAATESAYTIESTDVDAYVAERRDMLVVIAAGNEGVAAEALHAQPGFVDWLSIGSPASCKNALTVGAARSSRTEGGLSQHTYGEVWRTDYPEPPIAKELVSGDPQSMAAFSSRGPCDDRRIKPDVVAPGTDIVSTRSSKAPEDSFWALVPGNEHYGYMGGTSMATPLVTGCAVLVRQYYTDVRKYARPSAALLKATLINGTRWLSGDDAVADWPKRPNYHQGFGAVSLADSLPNTQAPGLRLEFLDTWEQPNLQFQQTGDRFQFTVTVEEGLPLRICLAYTDLPGRGLQNDVSLLVAGPGGRKFVGNADLPNPLTRSDADNNVEIVRVEEPTAGRYTVQVFARNLLRPPQDYALVISGKLASELKRAAG